MWFQSWNWLQCEWIFVLHLLWYNFESSSFLLPTAQFWVLYRVKGTEHEKTWVLALGAFLHCKCRYQYFAGLFRNRTSNRYFPWKKLSCTQKKGGSGPVLYCCCGSVPTIFSTNASNYQGKCLLEALFPGIRPVTFAVYRLDELVDTENSLVA